MTKEIYHKLKDDKHYYGEYGQQFLSNSNISTLLTNPLALHDPKPSNPAFLVGGYFHTAILEPHKLKSFKIVEASNRNTKLYKEISNGEMCLLKSEADHANLMTEVIMENDVCKGLIHGANVEYEQPNVTELFGNKWKGKADIINHDERLIIDLKTTSDIEKFRWSASKYNYDSQAYIYSNLFHGYEFLFMVIDKKTHQIGLFDCSPQFLERGAKKVEAASEQYDLFFKNDDFDPKQYLKTETL
ncbi:PD-(D/E)XK nuclease-like domain-containing protein [bacterium]|nr:PD-(D/E)XK nuclease-like domain-containing protein [bacterium]